MTYSATLDYLYGKLPMFTRIGVAAYKKDLHNTIALCDALGDPHHQFKAIHVGGTNGKGSTSHMLASILQQAGYKTGLYTSPHLKDFRERIRINGQMIPEDFVSNFVTAQKELIEFLQPSFFEVTVGMAFSYFAQEKVDLALIEVGLGGRLDSTNIITPELAVITNISLDHVHILGDNLAAIAQEKAGIIKPGVPVVIGERHPETDQKFIGKAQACDSPLRFATDELSLTDTSMVGEYLQTTVKKGNDVLFKALQLDLTGSYQLKNILTVIASVLQLREAGYHIADEAVYAALKKVRTLTGLQGRWQTLAEAPLTICDTGHNYAGILEVVQNISRIPYQKLHIVFGVLKDKDVNSVLKLLPKEATYYFTQPDVERALAASVLAAQARTHQLHGEVYPHVKLALEAAQKNAAAADLIFIGGSTFVVAEVL